VKHIGDGWLINWMRQRLFIHFIFKSNLFDFSAEYVFIVGHFPLWSTANNGPTACLKEKLRPLMKIYKAQVYIAGHDHNMQVLFVERNMTILIAAHTRTALY
jgi:hypothetical protein